MARANALHNAVFVNESPGKYQLWLDGFEVIGIQELELGIGSYHGSAEITIKISVNSVNRTAPTEERPIMKIAPMRFEDQGSAAAVTND